MELPTHPALALAELARDYVLRRHGRVPSRVAVVVRLTDDLEYESVTVELLPGRSAESSQVREDWVPNPVQKAILAALDSVALRTGGLERVLGDKSRIFRGGAMRELQERGLVKHHSRLGFYRPDCPPPELADIS